MTQLRNLAIAGLAALAIGSAAGAALADESGSFELTGVPPGEYQIVAWHEGWKLLRQEGAFDVLTEHKIQRPIFSDPRTWDKRVSVGEGQTAVVNFVLADK